MVSICEDEGDDGVLFGQPRSRFILSVVATSLVKFEGVACAIGLVLDIVVVLGDNVGPRDSAPQSVVRDGALCRKGNDKVIEIQDVVTLDKEPLMNK